jgi:two-component system cell cycle response regulator DivK
MASELILITEDNEKNRKLMREVLRVKGYQTLETETAEEGIRIAQESRPALILMDLQLPGIDGIAALGALRADPRTKGIPVIAVTASAMTHHRSQIVAAGFDGYQTKPLNVKEFLQVVREVLDRGRKNEEPS